MRLWAKTQGCVERGSRDVSIPVLMDEALGQGELRALVAVHVAVALSQSLF
jgi:hypothetical protein